MKTDKLSPRRHIAPAIAFALFVTALAWLDPLWIVTAVEEKSLALRHRLAAQESSHADDIVVVTIDDTAVRDLEPTLGRMPWSRHIYASAIRYLSREEARVIGFDLLFTAAHAGSGVEADALARLAAQVRTVDGTSRAALADEIAGLASDGADSALATATASARVVHSVEPLMTPDPQSLAEPSAINRFAIAYAPDFRGPVVAGLRAPRADLLAASTGIGANTFLNLGRASASSPVAISVTTPAVFLPGFNVAVAAAAESVSASAIHLTSAGISAGRHECIADRYGALPLRFTPAFVRTLEGAGGGYRVVAFPDLHRAASGDTSALEKLRGAFRDRVVLVGLALQKNMIGTPFGRTAPTALIHASTIDSILSDRHLRIPHPAIAIFLTAAGACFCALLTLARRPSHGAAASLVFIVLALAAAAAAFPAGWILPIALPTLAVGATFLATAVFRFAREKREIRSAFGKYVARSVLQEILENPDDLKLGGQRRIATILFTDIAGFSRLSEQLSPETIGGMLNDYLSVMTDCVIECEGTVDKYIGDAVMAEWNVPASQPDHAARACACALKMLSSLDRLRVRWREQGFPALEMRIGIHTGPVVAGNMGSEKIFDYTVIGDAVNTSARLEAFNKTFGSRIAVSEDTRAAAEEARPGLFRFRRQTRVVLRGQTKPIDVFELLGEIGRTTPAEIAIDRVFDEAVAHFLKGDRTAAESLFARALEHRPDDTPARRYLHLCRDPHGPLPDGVQVDAGEGHG